MCTFKRNLLVFCLVLLVVVIFAEPSFAAFDSLKETGASLFAGLRKIIYPASAVGIITVCMGGFFGNVNWKWLTAIIVGLVVISCCAGVVGLFVDDTGYIPADVMTGR